MVVVVPIAKTDKEETMTKFDKWLASSKWVMRDFLKTVQKSQN